MVGLQPGNPGELADTVGPDSVSVLQGCWAPLLTNVMGFIMNLPSSLCCPPEAATQKAALDLCSRGGRCLLQLRLQTEDAPNGLEARGAQVPVWLV